MTDERFNADQFAHMAWELTRDLGEINRYSQALKQAATQEHIIAKLEADKASLALHNLELARQIVELSGGNE